jgi:hypothetical protein
VTKQNNNQVVGNSGLYYVCYKLSLLGWNVMPTARNARGVDVLIYSQDAKKTRTIQVKTLSKRSAVPLGPKLENLIGDFMVVCVNVAGEPKCYVLKPKEVRNLAHLAGGNHWMEAKQYMTAKFQNKWGRIGRGQ